MAWLPLAALSLRLRHLCRLQYTAQLIDGVEKPAHAAEAGGSACAAGAGGSETPPLMKQKIGWTLSSPVRLLCSL